MFTDLRLRSQQLLEPRYDSPRELVSWMGAMQAQEYSMVKWAIGLRLKSGTQKAVEDSLNRGELLRTHVMRPTWHLVAAEDIRWMLRLSADRIKSACASMNKHEGITESLYTQSNKLIEKALEGKKHLSKQELIEQFERAGVAVDARRMTRFLMRAETDSLICSGPDKGKTITYALLEERVPAFPVPDREKSLAKLATHYFRSHSPAALQDFVWWSGLSLTAARQAMESIRQDLIEERHGANTLFIHRSCEMTGASSDEVLHLLPSFDEYIISYKDRSHALSPEHYPLAFNRFGTFYPLLLFRGRIVGNWEKKLSRKTPALDIIPFDHETAPPRELLNQATERCREFFLDGKG